MVSSKVTAAVSVAKRRVFTVGLIAAWYMSNFGIVLLNRYLLSSYGFHFPIFLTMCHMAACALLSYVGIARLRLVPIQRVRSRAQLVKIAALSVIFCSSVVGGNIALRYLPVSSTQAVGATTPVFTAVFAYLVTLRCEAWITYAVPVVAGVIIASGVRANFWNNVPIVAGVSVGSGGESRFHLYGFIMCIGAAAARALKSVLQGILLSSEEDKLSSMNLLLYMSPIAFLVLLPATLILEPNVMAICLSLARQDKFMISMLLVNSSMAYLVNLTNFLVTKHTSPLTLQVLGNAKGAVAFVVSILLGV